MNAVLRYSLVSITKEDVNNVVHIWLKFVFGNKLVDHSIIKGYSEWVHKAVLQYNEKFDIKFR